MPVTVIVRRRRVMAVPPVFMMTMMPVATLLTILTGVFGVFGVFVRRILHNYSLPALRQKFGRMAAPGTPALRRPMRACKGRLLVSKNCPGISLQGPQQSLQGPVDLIRGKGAVRCLEIDMKGQRLEPGFQVFAGIDVE